MAAKRNRKVGDVAFDASRGHWRLWYYDGGVGGVGRRRWERGYDTEDAARDRLAVILRQLSVAVGPVPHSEITFGEVAKAWIERTRATTKPSTLKAYRRDLNCYLLPRLKALPLDRLGIKAFADCVDDIVERDLSLATLNGAVRTLGALVTWAEPRYGLSMSAFGSDAARRKLLRPIRRALNERSGPIQYEQVPTWDHVLRFAAELEKRYPGHGANLVLLCAGSGLRISEALGLRVDDVDSTTLAIHVGHQLDRLAAWPQLAVVKGEIPQARTAYLWAHLRPVLEDVVANTHPDGWLFPPDIDQFGTRGLWWTNRLTERTHQAREAAGWTAAGWNNHWLRHHFASYSIASQPWGYDLPLIEVSAALGHKKPSTTTDMYLKKTNASAAVFAAGTQHVIALGGS